jgi:hypothetical protein
MSGWQHQSPGRLQSLQPFDRPKLQLRTIRHLPKGDVVVAQRDEGRVLEHSLDGVGGGNGGIAPAGGRPPGQA